MGVECGTAVLLWTMTTADPLLLATARVSTFLGPLLQTNASGFFFERDEKLYLVTSRHVVIDSPNKHLQIGRASCRERV